MSSLNFKFDVCDVRLRFDVRLAVLVLVVGVLTEGAGMAERLAATVADVGFLAAVQTFVLR